jgi:heptosyltransferase-3
VAKISPRGACYLGGEGSENCDGLKLQGAAVQMGDKQETIIIYRLGSIGDTVVSLPCFHLIARSFPYARRIVLTNRPISAKAAPLASVLEHGGLIDGTIEYHPRERAPAALMRVSAEIRATGAKTLVYLTEPRGRLLVLRDLAFFRLCGIRKIIGAPTSADLYHRRVDPATGLVEREAQRLSRCMRELGFVDVADPKAWDLRLTSAEREAAASALTPLHGRPFAAVNIGGKVAQKDWGDDNWMSLLQLLSSKVPDLSLAFFGSGDERDRSALLAEYWSSATVNLCGDLTPRESAAAMQSARLFLGHDSGPMHLAASVGTPCVALFGDYNRPKKWHPLGDQHRIIHNMSGIRAIRPKDVLDSVCKVLKDDALLRRDSAIVPGA